MPNLYRVLIVKSAEKVLKSLPTKDQQKIAAAIVALAIDPLPTGVKKLSGQTTSYRIRVGNYRVIYDILTYEILVTVLKIGHRKDVYR